MSILKFGKEQKQYLMLGAIVAIALAVLVVFGVKVSLSSIANAKLELQDLTGKIETAEKFLSKSQQDETEFRSTIAELKVHLETIPPDRNYYSWATEIVYAKARMVGFEIDAIDEIGIVSSEGDPEDRDKVKLEAYSLRIDAHGGYENIKRFLQQIALYHPLVRVTGIEISTGSGPDVHDVQLFIEWPFNLGYIAESWKSIVSEELPEADNQTTRPVPASGPTESPEDGEAAPKKEPSPPPPRTQPASRSVQVAPPASVETMKPDVPHGENHEKSN